MTTLIDAVQTQDPGSELVELIELELSSSSTLYFHSGVEADLTTVQFRDKTAPYAARTYTALPIEIEGVERKTDGASNRPSLTIANVLNTFSNSVGDLTNDDLIGKRVVRRQTLKKYLVGESADTGTSNPPIEFPSEKYIIDRIAGYNKVAVNFELASVLDLEGVKLPNRILYGKYCVWEYQGLANGRGGCYWPANSQIKVGTTSYKAYFTIDDKPLVPLTDPFSIGTAWSNSTNYGSDNWVTHSSKYWRSNKANTNSEPSSTNTNWTEVLTYTDYSNSNAMVKDQYYEDSSNTTVWKCLIAQSAGGSQIAPVAGSKYWARGDYCGKILSSCKCRFQFDPDTANSPNTFPSADKDTSRPMPFGGFPGSEKYR